MHTRIHVPKQLYFLQGWLFFITATSLTQTEKETLQHSKGRKGKGKSKGKEGKGKEKTKKNKQKGIDNIADESDKQNENKDAEDTIETIDYSHWYASVAIIVHKSIAKTIKYFIQHTGRIIEIALRINLNIDLVVVNNYSPHNMRPEKERVQHYETLKKVTSIHENNILMTVGDFKTRFHARRHGEEHILGPHIYGKGEDFMQKTIETTMEHITEL